MTVMSESLSSLKRRLAVQAQQQALGVVGRAGPVVGPDILGDVGGQRHSHSCLMRLRGLRLEEEAFRLMTSLLEAEGGIMAQRVPAAVVSDDDERLGGLADADAERACRGIPVHAWDLETGDGAVVEMEFWHCLALLCMR